jgi:hypothetical protein
MPYKAFNSDFTCLGFQFKVGEIYETKELEICKAGFHYCDKAVDCNNHYEHTPTTRYAEVEALGEIVSDNSINNTFFDSKKATNKIKIIKEITTEEWETLINGEKVDYNNRIFSRYKNNSSKDVRIWYKNGLVHRDGDLSAIVLPTGDQEYYKEGKCHRAGDLPAVIRSSGSQFWYKNGKLHRDNGKPAVIYNNGTRRYYINGELNETDDKICVIQ